MQLGARNLASVNPCLQIQVRVRLYARCGSQTRDSGSQIESWEGEARLLLELKLSSDTPSGETNRLRVIHVIVHSHQAGNRGIASEVKNLCSVGNCRRV